MSLSPSQMALMATQSYHAKDNLHLADMAYRQALEKDPENLDIRFMLASVQAQLGKADAAKSLMAGADAFSAVKANVYNDLGVKLKTLRYFDQAIYMFRYALLYRPVMPEALSNLAGVYCDLQLFDDALYHFNKALQLAPDEPAIHMNIGLALERLMRWEEAASHYQRAMELSPDTPQPPNNLGNVLQMMGRFDEALLQYEKAIAMAPGYAEPYNNIGFAWQAQSDLDKAETYFKKALEMDANYSDAQFNLTLNYLQKGDFKTGFAMYESRYTRDEFWPRRPIPVPFWDGSPLAGKRLLIMSEQGLGDTFQFLRFLPDIKALGATIIYTGQPELNRILKGAKGIDEWVDIPADVLPDVAYDTVLYTMSMPTILGTTRETLPPLNDPLALDPALTQRWGARMQADPNYKVAIVWSGNVKNPRNVRRACPPQFFGQVLAIPGMSCYSLQKGPMSQQAVDLQPYPNFYNWDADIQDFTDTAAILENVDLVITVDTAVAHLAGVMKKPTWLLLPYNGDWRWLANCDDSPWYPTMRIFRQTTPGDWQSVFTPVCQALQLECAERHIK